MTASPRHAPTAADALRQINDTRQSRWVLEGPLTGGFQAGAWLIRDSTTGDPAVLKWWDAPWWATRVLGAEPVIRQLREQGYPTPAWREVGTTAEGGPYVIQDLVEGRHLEHLDLEAAQLIVELTDRHRTVNAVTDVDWSAYTRRRHTDDLTELMKSSPEAAEAVRRALELAGQHDRDLPDHELVHGDLNISNVLTVGGQVSGVVDIEAVGRGCAAFDLLTPARQAALWQGDADAIDLLVETALSRYGAGVVGLTSAVQAIDIMAFGLQNWPHDLPTIAQRATSWLGQVRERL